MTQEVTGVFEGGGVRGIALAGAAAAALDSGYRFTESVGTSAGAIVSSLVAAGYTSTELRRAVTSANWPGRRLSPSCSNRFVFTIASQARTC